MAQALALVNLTEGGFATVNGDLPVFTATAWEDHVQAWTDAEQTVTERAFLGRQQFEHEGERHRNQHAAREAL